MYPQRLTTQVIRSLDYPVVRTRYGKLRGSLVEGIFVFRGIRYAKARRFHMPEMVESWEGIRDAVTYGYASCELNEDIPGDEDICPHHFLRADEHCQYMNIWTPTIRQGAGLPVVVWMHGGGWVSGSATEQFVYDGGNFARFGQVVFVNFNNRQNVLGSLDLSSFGVEYRDSVYAGLGDVLAAMSWIRENIEVFGGDPGHVTVIGQAGGGKRALALMQTPAADGLYQKMAVGSCAGERMDVPEGWTRRQIAQYMGELTAGELGLTKENIFRIESVPWWELAEAVKRAEKKLKAEIPDRFRWEPVPDGRFFFEDPFKTNFREETRGIPMMMGSSFGEMMGNSRVRIGDRRKNQWTDKQTLLYVKERYGEGVERLLDAFRYAYPNHRDADLLFVDQKIRPKLNMLAEKRAAAGEQVWSWLFHREAPVDDGLVAWHCSETAYILRNAAYVEAIYEPGITEELEELMSSAWLAFIRNGDPGCVQLPAWESVSEDRLPVMMFGEKAELRIDPEKKLYEQLSKKEVI